jgi:formylmethanofuran dehydrogenase subunit E
MDSVGVRGSRVIGFRSERHRHCDRCGRDVVQDRRRKDGLVLCIDCTRDHWLIKRFAQQVKS